jgi:hypothetical protein
VKEDLMNMDVDFLTKLVKELEELLLYSTVISPSTTV